MTQPTVWRLVPALGLTQIISWGSLYYSIAVLGASMRATLGISATTLFAAYSACLLISALAAPLAGRTIDRYGGRAVMSVGSVIAALSLLWIAHADSVATLFLAWGVAGLAMALTMYDAAFATLSQHTGTAYRTALTSLTLMGGLASTVFWPLSLSGLEHFGWRQTMLGFAALQLVVCLPLHLAFIPSFVLPPVSGAGGGANPGRTLTQRGRKTAFLALAACFALNGFIVSVLTVHLITILQGKGLALAAAVWVGSFFGPMQVSARLLEFSFGRRFSSRTVGVIALSLILLAVVVLLVLDGSVALAVAFALLFGCGNGIVTIVRGTVPAEIFGRAGYGSLLGNLAAPALFARAVAPLAFAPLADPGTPLLGWLLVLLLMAGLSVLSFRVAIRQH